MLEQTPVNAHENEAQTAVTPEVAEVAPANEPTEPEASEDNAEGGEEGEAGEREEGGLKPLANALNKQKRVNNKLRAERDAAQREIEQLKAMLGSREAVEAPDEAKYDSYADFLQARAEWAAKNAVNEGQKAQVDERIKSLEDYKKSVWVQERGQQIAEAEKTIAAEYPDYDALQDAALPVVSQFPDQLKEAFLYIENAPLAFYNLAKSGRLEELAHLPIEVARVEIAQAQYRKPPAPVRVASSAPMPMKSVSGKGTNQKSLDAMNPDEVLKHFGIK